MGEKRNFTESSWGNLKERDSLEYQEVNEKVILKSILRNKL
jgi:hypothetical protein